MVETASGSTYKQFVFRPSGASLAVYSGSLVKGTIPLPGGDTAVYNSSGLSFLRHTDWLGSSRLATTWAHTVYSKEAYAPFGETYNEFGTTPDRSFTGQDQDVVTGSAGAGVYDFLFRKYDPSAGRWLSPDPLGWGAVNQADPQSLDRYAYVENQPMNATDPAGLMLCVSGDGTFFDSGNGDCGNNAYPWQVTQTVFVNANGDTMDVDGCDPNGNASCMPTIGGVSADGVGSLPIGGPGSAPNKGPRSGYESLFCLGDALKSNGLSLVLDAVGLIPTGGSASAAFSLFHGAAGISNGTKILSRVQMGAGLIGTASAGNAVQNGGDNLDQAALATGGLSIAAALGKAAPVYGQVLSGISLGIDGVKTYQAQSACVNSGKYD
jgi:RHS repeat-associated protein